MKQIYLVPNSITAFGLACGLFVIFKVNMVEPGMGSYEMVLKSSLLLLLAAFADFIDGAVARAFHAESQFGFMFDSMSDAISFGVAPSVLLLKTLSLQHGTVFSFLAASGAMVFSLCGVLRLVRFNIKSAEVKGNLVEMTLQKKNFTGLPIPAAAIAAVSANLFLLSPDLNHYFFISDLAKTISLICIMVFLGYLMVSHLKFPSLKGLHFRVPSFHLAFFTVIIAIAILYGVFNYFALVLFFVSWVYIIVALILSIIRLIAGKKSKTLEDFEPDPDEFEDDK
ncbi:MAG: CDP-alcohol phosphatidyltransferase family protein [Chlamydiae bacterium]|nr:CDP-alcohol phosphatidyltransferase family protein [Chlamydiota bacterium]